VAAEGVTPAGRDLAEISAELEALRPPSEATRAGRNTARAQIEILALDLIEDCARLNKADLQRVELLFRSLGLPQEFVRQWRAAVSETRQQGAGAVGDKPDVIPYAADAGHLYQVTVVQTEAGPQLERSIIADFAALITEEMVNEDDSRHYLITGQTAEGRPFRIELSAEKFADDRALLAAMDAAAGAKAPVRARMGPHLRPAIKLLTRQAGLLPPSRRFERTGWADGKFLLPGRLPAGVHLSLLPTLPYELTPAADLAQGLAALVDVLEAMGPERLMISLGGIIIGPIAHLLAWDNERCAYFIQGRTGTLKTTTLQTLLCIWGALFLRDDRLIRWGESGGSLNAIMRVATYVADLPVLIDNYKPATGGGARGFTNMIHAIVEGSEKLRLTANSEMRAQRRIACWPHFTGEDCPTGDAASLARVLVVTLDWPRGQTNELLARAQSQAHHLNAIGRALLDWLESPDCQPALAYARREFPVRRAYWAKRIMAANSYATNPLRIASNLATNELAMHVVRQHPQIGPVIAPYMGRHIAGLEQCATEMAHQTADSLEATIFLNTLQELLATGELVLLPEAGGAETVLPERRAGWRATDGSVYLLGQKVLSDILKRLGPEALGRISPQTLFDQIKALDLLASTGRDKITRPMRLLEPETSGGPRRLVRVLHLKAEALEPPTDNEAGAHESPAAARNVRCGGSCCTVTLLHA